MWLLIYVMYGLFGGAIGFFEADIEGGIIGFLISSNGYGWFYLATHGLRHKRK